jgi:hypothetical protein
VRGSGWATDWLKAVRGLHELAHATEHPLRKGVGLNFFTAPARQKTPSNAVRN